MTHNIDISSGKVHNIMNKVKYGGKTYVKS